LNLDITLTSSFAAVTIFSPPITDLVLSWQKPYTIKNGSMIKQETFNVRTKSTGIWDYKDLKLDNLGNEIEYYANVDNGKYKIFVERSFIYF
jgi:hypothetical protein